MENKSRLALQVTKCAAQLMQDAGTFSHDSIELCLHIGRRVLSPNFPGEQF